MRWLLPRLLQQRAPGESSVLFLPLFLQGRSNLRGFKGSTTRTPHTPPILWSVWQVCPPPLSPPSLPFPSLPFPSLPFPSLPFPSLCSPLKAIKNTVHVTARV